MFNANIESVISSIYNKLTENKIEALTSIQCLKENNHKNFTNLINKSWTK